MSWGEIESNGGVPSTNVPTLPGSGCGLLRALGRSTVEYFTWRASNPPVQLLRSGRIAVCRRQHTDEDDGVAVWSSWWLFSRVSRWLNLATCFHILPVSH
jgi:hypothetical protein